MQVAVAGLAVATTTWAARPAPGAPPAHGELRSPADFAGIADRRARSLALYAEASKVLFHPRCLNCHPPDDEPRRGDVSIRHEPAVVRGAFDRGVPAMECTSCHQDRNLGHARVPGAPNWHLAPRAMAWLDRTPGQVCAQIKDAARNGGKTLDEVQHHAADDPLVGWGWAPGSGRTTPPGTQAEFGALVRAWIDSGAECPPEEAR
jgi:hypothetical protein